MGQIVINGAQIQSINSGATEIKEVWVGNVKIWPTSSTVDVPLGGQSGFLYGVSPVTVSKTTTSASSGTLTNTTTIKFNADGTMGFDSGTIVQSGGQDVTWGYWNDNVGALINPKINFNLEGITPGYTDIQVSLDQGANWATVQQGDPNVGNYSLTNGVWLRLPVSSATSLVKTVPNIQVLFYNNNLPVPIVAGGTDVILLTITSAVVVASNPFVPSFGTLTSQVEVPENQTATAYCRIFGPNHPTLVNRGKIEIIPFGGESAAYYSWIVPGQTAPSGTYTVRLDNWENLEPLGLPVESGLNFLRYSLPSDGEFYFEVVGINTGTSFKTGDGNVSIRRDNIAVSTGFVTLKAKSHGVIQ